MSAMSKTKPDETCSYVHIAKISEHIANWRELAPYFGLTPAEQEAIQMSDCNYKVQKCNMLWKWVRKQGDKATYRELKRVFEEAGEALLVCKVNEFLDDTRAPDSIVDTFRQHLKNCYSSTPVTHHGQKAWPPSPVPPLSDSPFVRPQLISKRTENGKVIGRNVQITDLFEEKKVMLEGTAGSGKTTLMRYICQQWANGHLLRDVDLLIHLSLADPTLWSAKSLEDLIPYPSADHIVKQQRNRVSFILDGWEDLPSDSSAASFIREVLEGSQLGVALPHCSFIVTTRPIASVSLQPLVTKTLEITGFSAECVDVYATKYLTQNGRDPAEFITKLNDNHYARGLCNLPINASILLYLFLAIHTGFPTSQTELFKCFILNLLLRHLVAKSSHHQPRLCEFSDLPPKEKQAFDKLCIIAHHATFISSTIASHSNQLLSDDDLSKAGVDGLQETMGLMKVHHQLTWCGYDPHYGFLHSSVQDFLCAVRMSQLSAEDQVRDFIRIMTSNPTSPVLRFYAGITKLKNEKVCRYLCQIGKKAPEQNNLLELERTRSVGCDRRRLFLSYLHCLYEANKNILVSLHNSNPSYRSIYLMFIYYRLSVHDLNVIFYYILDIATKCSANYNVVFTFCGCSVGDHAIQSSVTTLGKQAEKLNQPASFGLTLSDVFYTHEGVRTIMKLITMKNVNLSHLSLQYLPPSSNVSIVLRTLTEALLSPNSAKLTTLGLFDCNLTAGLHVYYLILLLTQAQYLLRLDIGSNIGLQHHIPLLVTAGQNLIELRINDLLADEHLLAVGQILQSSNTRLEILNICSSLRKPMYSFQSVVKFIKIITARKSRSNLKLLIVDFNKELKRSEKVKRALDNSALRHCGFPLHILQSYEHDFNLQSFVASQSLPKSLVSGRT